MTLIESLELLLLSEVLTNFYCDRRVNRIKLDGIEYDYDKIYERYKVLMKVFLEPYVINKDSKG